MKRVVITGLGTINPLGHNVEDTWQGLLSGVCGIDKITRYYTTNRKVTVAAEVKDYFEENYFSKKEA